jgi:hypothetical protein
VPVTVTGNAVVSTVTVSGGSGLRGNVGTIQLSAVAASGLGNAIAAPITWTTNTPAIATVDATGLVTFVGGTGPLTVTGTAAGAGNNGANVSATATFEVRTQLVAGVVTAVPDISEGQFLDYVVLSDGSTSFRVQTGGAGSTGDVDMYIFAPGVTNPVANNGGGSGWACRPWLIGNGETCNFATPAAGFYRVRLYAYNGDGDVKNLLILLTSPIPPA